MLTEDYLIRMINIAIAALLRLVGLKKAGDYQEARLLIDITFEQLLGLRASVAKNLDDDRLYYLLTRNGQLDTRRLALIAELFRHEGDIAVAQQSSEEAQAAYSRALRYSLEVWFQESADTEPDSDERAERRQTIEALAAYLDPAALGAETLWPLAGFYEDSGQYDRAEAVLLRLVARPEIEAEIRPELIAFYDRLLELPPAVLATGGLSADVVRTRRQTL